MRIYIDFDDVICETALYFTKLVKEMYGVDVPYQDVKYFNLKMAFNLSDEQYDELMKVAHYPENLLSFEETLGAAQTINKWVDSGHDISVITGRPFSAYEPSRKWLDEHGLERVPVYCLDKYGRENIIPGGTYNMTMQQFYSMSFDFFIEDSPIAFEHLLHFDKGTVAVFDRPWNRSAQLPNERFVRCCNWKEVDRLMHRFE